MFVLAVMLVGTFLLANPLAAARYWTGMAGIAMLSFLWLRHRRTGSWLYSALVVGVLVIMPLANAGRGATDVGEMVQSAEVEVSAETLMTGDAESFSALLI